MERIQSAIHSMPSLEIGQHNVVPGRHYRTPKEVWGFRLGRSSKPPRDLARAVLKANAGMIGLDRILTTLRCRHVKSSLGGWHVIFSQHVLGHHVHRAYVSVHMNRARQTYLIKSRAVPRDLLPGPSERHQLGVRTCRRLALRSLSRTKGAVSVMHPEQLWFPVRDHLRAAFKFRVLQTRPRHEWIIYVDAVRGSILSKYDNLAKATGYARVFNPNPVIALGSSDALLEDGEPIEPPEEAYEHVRLTGLKTTGFLDGVRVTTNLTRPRVTRQRNLRFEFNSNQRGFDEAMIYFHIDSAIQHLQRMGYRGARRIFDKPLAANAHGTRDDNAWYSPGLRTLTFGTGDVDEAEDGETILHEFGHALQDAICPDFGQSPEAAAMGEGFGDYFAASFTAEEKKRKGAGRYLATVMSWDGIFLEGDPPCVRRLDTNLTYESFSHATRADEHDNGQIWSAALWDIWNAIGREHADPVIIDSHFQLDGFTTLAKGARAILDADRNLNDGRHIAQLKRIFHRRGIGPIE